MWGRRGQRMVNGTVALVTGCLFPCRWDLERRHACPRSLLFTYPHCPRQGLLFSFLFFLTKPQPSCLLVGDDPSFATRDHDLSLVATTNSILLIPHRLCRSLESFLAIETLLDPPAPSPLQGRKYLEAFPEPIRSKSGSSLGFHDLACKESRCSPANPGANSPQKKKSIDRKRRRKTESRLTRCTREISFERRPPFFLSPDALP